jgi:hypothetical protein
VIVIPRGVCRAVPALARKCVSGRPRGPAPVVVCEVAAGTLTVWARTPDAILAYSAPCRDTAGETRIVVPMAALAAAGPGTEPVEVVVGPGLAAFRRPARSRPSCPAGNTSYPTRRTCGTRSGLISPPPCTSVGGRRPKTQPGSR